MLTEDGVSGKMRLGKMAVGLRPENVTIHHSAEKACPVREIKRQNPTLTEVGVPGIIRQLETASLGSENVTILHSVEQESHAREIKHGKVKNVPQVREGGAQIRDMYKYICIFFLFLTPSQKHLQ